MKMFEDPLVGNTPLIKISDKIYAKFEAYNPSGSIKDRMASYIIAYAEKNGELKPGDVIVEASSGNTGIAFSLIGARKGYKVKIIMPSNMSEERKKMICLFGAELIEVGPGDFKGAIALRDKMVEENSDHWAPKQFSNMYNVYCHQMTTGMEIIGDVARAGIKEDVAAIVSGAGTGGTLMGSRIPLRTNWPSLKTVLVVPDPSEGSTHGIQGIGDGDDYLVNRSVLDGIIKISTDDASARALRLLNEQGLFVGISSGANVLAAERWIEKHDPAGIVITFLPDRGERYLSEYIC